LFERSGTTSVHVEVAAHSAHATHSAAAMPPTFSFFGLSAMTASVVSIMPATLACSGILVALIGR
jgi:hypothetical protein